MGNLALSIAEQIQALLRQVVILSRGISLITLQVYATVPMLRGVGGPALHALALQVYVAFFVGAGHSPEPIPLMILRPASPSAEETPALDRILIGNALEYHTVLLRAWDIVSAMGLGPSRRRFHIRECRSLIPRRELPPITRKSCGWSLYQAAWLLEGAPDSTTCCLRFLVTGVWG